MMTTDGIPTKTRQTASVNRRRNDLFLIIALLLIIAIAALALTFTRQSGDTVTVTIDGKLFGEYRLDEEQEIEIRTENGYNLLMIQNGTALMCEASCPDGICVSHRQISHSGESIICLPNKVVIEVHTQTHRDEPDIIS